MLKTNKTFGLKGLLFAFFTALIASTAITACSDDDSQGNNDNNPTIEEESKVDELEMIRERFIYTDTAGVEHIVMGVALDASVPDELSVGAADSSAAIAKFLDLMSDVDSTHFTSNVDGSIIVTPTDSLGNVQGTITFAFASAGSNMLATVTFEPEDMVPGVRQLNYILSSQWPTNASTIHYRGRKQSYVVPRVRYDSGGTIGYLDPDYTKTVDLVCANTPEEGETAYYVYFDNVPFSPYKTYDIRRNEKYMDRTLPSKSSLRQAIYMLVCDKREYVYPNKGWVEYSYTTNDWRIEEAIAMGVDVQDRYYYTSSWFWWFGYTHYALNPQRTYKFYYDYGLDETKDTDFKGKDSSEFYPFAIVVEKAYDETW